VPPTWDSVPHLGAQRSSPGAIARTGAIGRIKARHSGAMGAVSRHKLRLVESLMLFWSACRPFSKSLGVRNSRTFHCRPIASQTARIVARICSNPDSQRRLETDSPRWWSDSLHNRRY
jgi:hypothetical protein